MNEVVKGRPSKLNENLIFDMAYEIAKGLPVKYACDLFGVTTGSFFSWMKTGEQDFENDVDSIYALFFDTIKKAQAEFVRNIGEEIRKGNTGWQGKAWWLERTRQDFMPKQMIQSDTEDGKVTVVFGSKPKEIKHENNK